MIFTLDFVLFFFKFIKLPVIFASTFFRFPSSLLAPFRRSSLRFGMYHFILFIFFYLLILTMFFFPFTSSFSSPFCRRVTFLPLHLFPPTFSFISLFVFPSWYVSFYFVIITLSFFITILSLYFFSLLFCYYVAFL